VQHRQSTRESDREIFLLFAKHTNNKRTQREEGEEEENQRERRAEGERRDERKRERERRDKREKKRAPSVLFKENSSKNGVISNQITTV